MNLTLVSIHIEQSPRSVPLGAAMIASALKNKFSSKLDIVIEEFYLNQNARKCAEAILESSPDYAGFSLYLWNRNLSLKIAAILKEKKPELVIFAGGPEIFDRLSGENLLQTGVVDFFIQGEGEESAVTAFEMILSGKSIEETAAAVSEKSIPSLDKIPSPWLDKTLDLKKYEGVLWELSRGCPFKCDFCFESRGTHGVRNFPFERAEKELELFVKSNVRQIFILDPTFNADRKKAKHMLRLLNKTAGDIHFTIEIRAEFLDEETAGLFALINCSLQIGLQSSSTEVLEKINRSIDKDLFSEKILLLHEAGVTYGFDLIYGLPGDTLSGFYDSIDYALSLSPNHLDIFQLAVLPGTRLHDNAKKLDLKYQKENPYHIVSTPLFSESDMAHAASAAFACDLFYNRGKAVPWFSLMLENLGIQSAELLSDFALWLSDKNIDPHRIKTAEDIINVQLDFLFSAFNAENKSDDMKIISDLIKWFGYSSALLENEASHHAIDSGTSTGSTAADHPRYRLNSELFLTEFNYDIESLIELIESGTTDFSDIASILPEASGKAAIYIYENELVMRYLSEVQLNFLVEIKNRINGFSPNNELRDFITEAEISGLLIP